MTELVNRITRLQSRLGAIGPLDLAVSGGVDSLTLALVAGRTRGTRSVVWHALSPAVPPAASERVRAMAAAEDWDLRFIEAGEFADENYLANPYRRCFHCKRHLYSAIAGRCDGTILSGTNRDDLGDFRPGLEAAAAYGVRHPFVECGLRKADVRAIAAHFGYSAIAELPAAPCLSSRVQTGLRIQAPVLGFVDRVENLLSEGIRPRVVRCRILQDAIAVQLDPHSLHALDAEAVGRWRGRILDLASPLGLPDAVRFEPYRMGSAFVDVA